MVGATQRAGVVETRPLAIAGALELISPVHRDQRGWFREWFREDALRSLDFVPRQANLSHSRQRTVRGLHYSLASAGQAKVVTCVVGHLDDVLVDVRVGSPTFGAHVIVSLRDDEGRSVLVPSGVAHGFVARSEIATMSYLLSSPYSPENEAAVNVFDDELAIAWHLDGEPILSNADRDAPSLSEQRASNLLPTFVS